MIERVDGGRVNIWEQVTGLSIGSHWDVGSHGKSELGPERPVT